MAINFGRKVVGRLLLTAMLTLSMAGVPAKSEAQNIFQKLLGKESVESQRHSAGSGKQKKEGKNKKKEVQQLDATELSLDENVASPEIPVKHQAAIKEHMTVLAKNLAKRKTAKIETMRDGEVVVATLGTDRMFAPNDTVLLASGKELLKPYTQLLAQHPGWYKMLVVVHTDDTGSDEYTDWLSEMRVEAVYQALAGGTESSRSTLIPYALGATEPRLPNISMTNRAANRRVEIFIVPDQKLINLAKSNKLVSK